MVTHAPAQVAASRAVMPGSWSRLSVQELRQYDIHPFVSGLLSYVRS